MSSNWVKYHRSRWQTVAILIRCLIAAAIHAGWAGCASVENSPAERGRVLYFNAPLGESNRQVRHPFLIDFDRGFDGETFSVFSADERVATTTLQSREDGPADWLSLESTQPELTLRFRNDDSGREWQFFFDLTRGTYFAVDFIEDDLNIRQSPGPFMYGSEN